jgi:hypothetical protein
MIDFKIGLASAALLLTAPALAQQQHWFIAPKFAPTECVDVSVVGNGVFSPASIIETERGAGSRVRLFDHGEKVFVVAQGKDGQNTVYQYYRTLEACQKDVGYLPDTAPSGADLKKYR